ncbi:MAG: class F sortase [Pseudonocardiaceae bacterium]
MSDRSHRRGGRNKFVAAITAGLSALLMVACTSGPTSATGSPTSPATPAPPPLAPAAASRPINAAVLAESAPLSVQIPAIGLATDRLIDLGLAEDRTLEVPGDAGTAGWFTLSPTPGELGPSVLAGHVNYKSVPGVFSRLHEMHPGDTITIDRADGTSAVFTTYQVDLYPKSDFPTEQVYGNTDQPELRLITCGGSFDPAARSYRDNVVVFAKLTSAHWR